MKCKLCFLPTAMLLYSSVLYAQFGTSERSILSLQTGPTFYTGKLIGIAGYSSNLRNGIGWSGSYTYLVGNKPAIRAGFGILYQAADIQATRQIPQTRFKHIILLHSSPCIGWNNNSIGILLPEPDTSYIKTTVWYMINHEKYPWTNGRQTLE